jgi:hypothetical protein
VLLSASGANAPNANQVLTFDGPAVGWRPKNLPDPSALAGDVTGAPSATTVVQLRGTPVAPAAPASNQVLTFVGGAWTPAGLPNLGGDVTGTIDVSRVVGLQTIPVASDAPVKGDVLTYDGANWRPSAGATNGQFVGRAASEAFTIVAAGIVQFKLDQARNASVAAIPQTYNGLKEANPNDPLIVVNNPPPSPPTIPGIMLTFKGMKQITKPSDSRYIVKLTPWLVRGQSGFLRFFTYFGGFSRNDPAFAVIVEAADREIPMPQGFVMVEVSEFAV